jgi:hypothetical protein
MKKRTFLSVLLIMLMVFFISSELKAQSQPYQVVTTCKYVKSNAYDTVSLPGLSTSSKVGIITNEGPAKLIIFFTKRGVSTIDSTAFFLLDTGRTLKFSTYGTKILRKAQADSCFSQVLLGGVELMMNDNIYQEFSSTKFLCINYNPEAESLFSMKMPNSCSGRSNSSH